MKHLLLVAVLVAPGCSSLFARPEPDVPAPIEKLAEAAPGVGGLIGGPTGTLIGGAVSTALLAAYGIWQKMTEAKRHAIHSSARGSPPKTA